MGIFFIYLTTTNKYQHCIRLVNYLFVIELILDIYRELPLKLMNHDIGNVG